MIVEEAALAEGIVTVDEEGDMEGRKIRLKKKDINLISNRVAAQGV